MIRLKVFISSVQKELKEERLAVGSILATDPFLSETTVPRIFEEYPAPLRPNKHAYLDLLRTCQIYLLILGKEYGVELEEGMSATHQEYLLAQKLDLPTLVCVKGERSFKRDPKEEAFFDEIEKDKHNYSRFLSVDELQEKVRTRLAEYIETTFDTTPTKQQEIYSRDALRAASNFERQPVSVLSLVDCNQSLANELVAAAEEKNAEKVTETLIQQALTSRGYLWWDIKEAVYRPTAAGCLLLAPKPSIAFPQTRVQLDAYTGKKSDDEPIDSILLDESLPKAIEQTVAFIRRNLAQPLKVKGLKRKPSEQYPQEALREAIVNAVAHRDYAEAGSKIAVEVFSDRVVVMSPGRPPGGQSIEQIEKGQARSRARNPLIVQGLTWLGYMDERGSGIRRMRKAMQSHGLPAPHFDLTDGDFTVTLVGPTRLKEVDASKEGAGLPLTTNEISVESNDQEILKLFGSVQYVKTEICVQKLGISRNTAWRILKRLTDNGILEKIGTGRGTRYKLVDKT